MSAWAAAGMVAILGLTLVVGVTIGIGIGRAGGHDMYRLVLRYLMARTERHCSTALQATGAALADEDRHTLEQLIELHERKGRAAEGIDVVRDLSRYSPASFFQTHAHLLKERPARVGTWVEDPPGTVQ